MLIINEINIIMSSIGTTSIDTLPMSPQSENNIQMKVEKSGDLKPYRRGSGFLCGFSRNVVGVVGGDSLDSALEIGI